MRVRKCGLGLKLLSAVLLVGLMASMVSVRAYASEQDACATAGESSSAIAPCSQEGAVAADEATLADKTEAEEDGTAEEPSVEAVDADKSWTLGPSLQAQSSMTVSYIPASPIEFIIGSVEWDDFYGAYPYSYVQQPGDKLKVTTGGVTETFTCSKKGYSWLDSNGYAVDMQVNLYAELSEAQNTLGTHTMQVDVYYYKWNSEESRGTVSFEIVRSPLTSISYAVASPIVLVRGSDSSSYYEYDTTTKTGHTYHHYFFPRGTRLMGDKLVLTHEDGTVRRFTYGALKESQDSYDDYGFVNDADPSDTIAYDDLSFTADQSYAHRWKAGSHAFTLQYLGKTTTIPVTVRYPKATKVAYVRKKAERRSTAAAIVYTKNMGVYDPSYASKVTKYEIVFSAPTPAAGDVLKVTAGGKVGSYAYVPSRSAFVNTTDSDDVIPARDVAFGALTATPAVTKTRFPCSYQGIDFTIPFTVEKAAQKVKASSKQVVVGKKAKISARSTGFAESKLTYTSSNKKVARVNAWGVVTAKKVGRAKITIRAKANAAYKASKKKVITIRVGKKNPMRVRTKKKKVRVKRGKTFSFIIVSKARGAVRYKNVSANAVAKKFKVLAKSGKVRVPKATKRGTYTLKVRVRAAGKGVYLTGTKVVQVKVVVR